MGTYKYKAFISYSHRDDRWGRWLHKRLENYPLPKNIVGNVTKTGEIPKRLKPIFRDREELAAADNLGDKIEQALENSENLIMICSPQAARSHWVNQEVLYFKRHNRGAQIFCVIVEGEPFASNIPGREDEECFPPALRYQLDEDGELSGIPAEPLAADMRDHADGKRLGVLKLVSGMIGVGLDEVVQRDMRRGRQRVTAITTGALATVLAMGTLTGFALDARAEAEQQRVEAEGLITFMLTDLRDKLTAVGRLDMLEDVSQESVNYYLARDNRGLSCDGFSMKARAIYEKSRISRDKADLTELGKHATQAVNTLKPEVENCKDNPQFIINYAHAQQWVLEYQKRSLDLSQKISDLERVDLVNHLIDGYAKTKATLSGLSTHPDWKLQHDFELSDVDILQAAMYFKLRRYKDADDLLAEAQIRLEPYTAKKPAIQYEQVSLKYADILSWRGYIREQQRTNSPEINPLRGLDAAYFNNRAQKYYERVATPMNWRAYFSSLKIDFRNAKIHYRHGEYDQTHNLLNYMKPKIDALKEHDPQNLTWQEFSQNVIEFHQSIGEKP